MEWKIKPRSSCCQATQEPFDDGEVFYTLLIKTEDDGIERRDLSGRAWGQLDSKLEVISFWKSCFKNNKDESKDEPVQSRNAEDQLRKLIKSELPADLRAAYILAAFLERKRILKNIKKQEIETDSFTVYEHTETQEIFMVKAMKLHLNHLEELKHEALLSFQVSRVKKDGEPELEEAQTT